MKLPQSIVLGLSLLTVLLAASGCPVPAGPQEPSAALTLLLTAGEELAAGAGIAKAQVIQPSAIARLDVVLDEVLIARNTSDGPIFESVFTGPTTLDLKSLLGLSEVLDTARVPLGTYSSLELVFSSATLYLASAPSVALTNVSFFDNGRIRVPVDLVIANESEGMLLLDLGGIHLTQLDAGDYVLTPEIAVSKPQTPVPSQAIGRIQQLDLAAGQLVLGRKNTSVTVDFVDARIFRRNDFDTPTGSSSTLRVGDEYLALGTLGQSGALIADLLVQLDDDGDDDSEGEGDDDSEGEGDDDSEGEGDDDSEGEGDDDSEGEGDDDSEGEGDDDSEGEGDDDSEGEGDDDSDDNNGDAQEQTIRLAPAVNLGAAKAEVEYEVRSDRRKLKFEVERLGGFARLAFLVDGVEVGQRDLAAGRVELELDSRFRSVPVVTASTQLAVIDTFSGVVLFSR